MDFKKAKNIAECVMLAERWKMYLKKLEDDERYSANSHFGIEKPDMTEMVESKFSAAKSRIKNFDDEGNN